MSRSTKGNILAKSVLPSDPSVTGIFSYKFCLKTFAKVY